MALIDDLLANPGLYVGIDRIEGTDHTGVARIVVTPLPGGSGVSLDYEVLGTGAPDGGRSHVEHTVLARGHDGTALMVIGHTHAEGLEVLRETVPGTFERPPGEPGPFPVKVVVSVPAPGRIRHAWWYGRAGDEPVERDVAEVVRQD
jgi:hypothetical protein